MYAIAFCSLEEHLAHDIAFSYQLYGDPI